MMEFALVLSLLILILGAFFDIGLALHNWMLLRTVTLDASRAIAVNFATEQECDRAEEYLADYATPRLRNAFGADVARDEMNWRVEWLNPSTGVSHAPTFPKVRLSGHFHVGCLFICRVLPGGLTLSAASETVIELEMENGVPCQGFAMRS